MGIPFSCPIMNGKTSQKISKYEDYCPIYCKNHSLMNLANSYFSNISPLQFWTISEQYPDLVKHLQKQVKLMGQFSVNGGVPWPSNTDGALCFICKSETEDFNHFVVNCSNFRKEFESLSSNLKMKSSVLIL